MSSFLLQAQASKAKIIGVANVGADFRNIVIGAADFGLLAGGQKLASMIVYDADIIALGLDKARGLLMTTAYYWDLDDKTRSFAERFFKRRNVMPNMIQASVYSSVAHYLKAAKATGTVEPEKILPQMRAMPVNDIFATNGKLRPDGLMEHDTYLLEVKTAFGVQVEMGHPEAGAPDPGGRRLSPAVRLEVPDPRQVGLRTMIDLFGDLRLGDLAARAGASWPDREASRPRRIAVDLPSAR